MSRPPGDVLPRVRPAVRKEPSVVLTTGGLAKIHILPGDVVSRIAAGEVIERPAAVVKELIENSLDAGSRTITVDIKDGGLTLIRVIDDGEGMSREDAPRAFERHATSKLRSDRDLWAIRTMGFRGEALPSIASVARVRVTTATADAAVGTAFEVHGGRVGTILDAPPVAGTRIEVAELFYNQPARKKFLKSMATEFSHISRTVQQAALAWPAVHLRLVHNQQEVFNYPAVASERDRIAQVYRSAFADRSLPVSGRGPGLSLSGLAVDPVQAGSGRTPQDLFVNRRPVKNAAVFHAVSEGYGSFLSKGHHPRFVLFLDVDPAQVDVNVHPTKREVRFADGETIHQLVRRAVRDALGGSERTMRDGPAPERASSAGAVRRFAVASPLPSWAKQRSSGGGSLAHGLPESAPSAVGEAAQLVFANEQAESYLAGPAREILPLGQLNRTFLVVQIGGDLAVIDQHTAHERVLFERLVRAWTARTLAVQPLLIPEPVELSAPQAALLQRYLGELEPLGLELEPFGATAVLVRALPARLGPIAPAAFLADVLDDLGEWERTSAVETRSRAVLASMACHGAVRSGRSLELPEIAALVKDWQDEGEIMTCPHGRRTVFRLGTSELEKMFGRAGW